MYIYLYMYIYIYIYISYESVRGTLSTLSSVTNRPSCSFRMYWLSSKTHIHSTYIYIYIYIYIYSYTILRGQKHPIPRPTTCQHTRNISLTYEQRIIQTSHCKTQVHLHNCTQSYSLSEQLRKTAINDKRPCIILYCQLY